MDNKLYQSFKSKTSPTLLPDGFKKIRHLERQNKVRRIVAAGKDELWKSFAYAEIIYLHVTTISSVLS